ncbi:MAG: hypothetical protein D6815_06745 [Candidatus Dadabacteria bacterium]|nr:MAG: hypothetical protein D6815_06745 [Candidatus Dadabacteria bacterium]
MELYRVGVKLFCEAGHDVPLVEFIPIFHRWIQTRAIDGLLIDVADYSHITNGPGIVLVAHEGNLAIDEGRGRRGLAYYVKRPQDGPLETRLAAVLAHAAKAAILLAAEDTLAGRMRLGGSEIEFFSNDRLVAANDEQGHAVLEPAVRAVASRVYGQSGYSLERASEDPRERLALVARSQAPVTVEELEARARV